jgi:hypothetical protein
VERTAERISYSVRYLSAVRFTAFQIPFPAVNCWSIFIRPLRGLINLNRYQSGFCNGERTGEHV